MSQATKRKHVVKEVLGDLIAPTENQQIVRILGSPGNNLHEAVTTQGEHFLVSMPTKFRKNIWIKRGDFVIVDPIEEGGKVRGEIVSILYKDHIRHLRSQGAWPEGFLADYTMEERRDREQTGGLTGEEKEGDEDGGASGSEDDDSDLFVNTNRINYHYSESEEEEDEDEEEENSHGGKD